MGLLGIDFGELIGPDMSVIETVLRGTVVYFVIFVLLRLVLRGRTGGTTMSDLLVLVLVADAAQNAMADEYRSLANGTVLVATIIGWSFALDWLAYRVPAVERVVHPEKTPLVQNGRLIRSEATGLSLRTDDGARPRWQRKRSPRGGACESAQRGEAERRWAASRPPTRRGQLLASSLRALSSILKRGRGARRAGAAPRPARVRGSQR